MLIYHTKSAKKVSRAFEIKTSVWLLSRLENKLHWSFNPLFTRLSRTPARNLIVKLKRPFYTAEYYPDQLSFQYNSYFRYSFWQDFDFWVQITQKLLRFGTNEFHSFIYTRNITISYQTTKISQTAP